MIMGEDGKVAMLHSMGAVMHLAQWEALVDMVTYIAKVMGPTLQHLALLCSTMASAVVLVMK